MSTTLTPDAALLLRRILVAPSSELESVHTATDRMTELVDELRAAKLVIMQGGKWVVTPPGTDTWTAPTAVAKLRAVLVDGAEDTESAALLTSWGVPLTVPFARASDAWMARIYAVPERHFKVHDVLRLAPDAGMRGERTPADEVEHWITEGLLPSGQISVHSKGIYTFPEPAAEDLDDALVELRAGRYVHPRIETELVMGGDAERLPDGTVVPVAHGSPAPVTETPETKPVETSLSDRIVAALGEMGKADAADLAARLGVHHVEVSRALIELGEMGRAEKMVGSLSWRLPSKTETPATPAPEPSKSGVPATKSETPAPSTASTSTDVAKTKTDPAKPSNNTALLVSMDGNIRQLVQLHTLSQSSAREALQGENTLHAVLFRVMVVTQKLKTPLNKRDFSLHVFRKREERDVLDAALAYGVTTGALTSSGVWGTTYIVADPIRVGVSWAELNTAAAKVRMTLPKPKPKAVTSGK